MKEILTTDKHGLTQMKKLAGGGIMNTTLSVFIGVHLWLISSQRRYYDHR